jgi:hypothetical protein
MKSQPHEPETGVDALWRLHDGVHTTERAMKVAMGRSLTGLEMDVVYPTFNVSLTLLSVTQLRFEIKEEPFARTETVDIHVVPLGNRFVAVSWQERDGTTVTNVQDCSRGLVHSFATLPDGRFMRMPGTFTVTRPAARRFDELSRRDQPAPPAPASS